MSQLSEEQLQKWEFIPVPQPDTIKQFANKHDWKLDEVVYDWVYLVEIVFSKDYQSEYEKIPVKLNFELGVVRKLYRIGLVLITAFYPLVKLLSIFWLGDSLTFGSIVFTAISAYVCYWVYKKATKPLRFKMMELDFHARCIQTMTMLQQSKKAYYFERQLGDELFMLRGAGDCQRYMYDHHREYYSVK